MQYRKLKLEDHKAYCEIREKSLKLYPESFGTTIEESTSNNIDSFALTTNHNFNFIAGAFNDDILVGIAGFLREEKKKLKHKGSIWGMFVDPSAQGKKVGFNLLDFLVKKAFAIEDLNQIKLAVVATNKNAVNLYEKSGFTTYGIEKNSLCNGNQSFDDFLMVRFKNQ